MQILLACVTGSYWAQNSSGLSPSFQMFRGWDFEGHAPVELRGANRCIEGGALGATTVLSNGPRAGAGPGQWMHFSATVGNVEAALGPLFSAVGRLRLQIGDLRVRSTSFFWS